MPDSALYASRYRILRTLGSGGMGVVYLAEDTRKDHKIMALKTMKPQGGAEATESFRAEFLNIRGVVHPNIPEVFDFGILPETETQLYFTCEFVAGNSLDHLAATWTPQQLQVVLVSLCRALAFLHSRGLLHRDIKPQNVLGRLGSNGQLDTLKLVDFGLSAKREESAEFAGTMDYMAPELIGGESASMVSDIYAIGMLIYRLATGHLPFEGTDPIAVTRQRCIAEAPPALRFSPDLPVGLSDVIGTLIRIRPEDRPSSARHVIALLNEHQGTEYPYETVETRSAYIRSAVTVTHREVRETMRQMRLRRAAGEPVKPVLVLGPRGLGRRRLLGAFAAELGVDGCAVRLAETERDLEQGAADVLIVPDVSRLDAEKLRIAVETARSRDAWILLGGAGVPPELPAMFPSLDRLTLHPLEAPEVAEFLTAMFPENNFQGTFAEQLHSRTMGFTAAIERALQHLLDTEQLRIGLSGWELMPGRWDVPIHPAVPEHVQAVGEHLSGGARRLAEVVACSSSALPRAVLLEMYGDLVDPSASLDTAIAELNRVGWLVKTEDSYRLRHSAAAELVENSQDPEEHRRFHRLLARAWAGELLRDHPLRDRELLYHHIHSADWDIAPDYTAAQLRSVLDEGNAVWVRKLIETGVLLDPPPRLGDVLLDALVVVEFIEGNIEASAERLGNVLQHGEIEVAEENLERMARYAGLEEKLGRADRAQIILERCLQVLPAGHDSRAGMVFGPLAWILFKQGDAEKARELAEEGLIRIPPHAADFGQALLLNTVATLAFYRGDLDAAELYWKRCLEVYETIGDRQGIASMYNSLGALAAQSGDRLRARSLWQRCAAIAREINDVHRLAGIYNNLGIDALESGALREAEDHYRKALSLFRRMKNPRAQVEILSNLGELAYYRADYPRAQAYLQEAVHLASTLDDREVEIEPLLHLGRVLLTLDELETATAHFQRSCQTAAEVGSMKGEGQAWEHIALVQARRGRLKSALAALERATRLLSEDMDPLARVHLHLTACAVAAERQDEEGVRVALESAHEVAKTKWDPFAAARSLVYGLLFAQEIIDSKERPRVLRQLAVYPDFLWRFHWAAARRLAAEGAVRKALDEFGKGVNVLKGIASRLPDEGRDRYLNSPQIRQFRSEAIALKNQMKDK